MSIMTTKNLGTMTPNELKEKKDEHMDEDTRNKSGDKLTKSSSKGLADSSTGNKSTDKCSGCPDKGQCTKCKDVPQDTTKRKVLKGDDIITFLEDIFDEEGGSIDETDKEKT